MSAELLLLNWENTDPAALRSTAAASTYTFSKLKKKLHKDATKHNSVYFSGYYTIRFDF